MTRKREKLQAYFAGFFDGEGCVGVYKHGAYWRTVATITNTNPTVIALLQREYPEGFVTRNRKAAPRKDAFEWRVSGQPAERFLREIKPYTIQKQEQVAIALSFLVAQGREFASNRRSGVRGSLGYSEQFKKRAERVSDRLKELKSHSAVNSVNALLKHELREYRAEPEDVERDAAMLAGLLEGVETSVEASTSQ